MAERTNTSAFDPGDTIRLQFAITASTAATDYVNSPCRLILDKPQGSSISWVNNSTTSTGLVHLAQGRYQADVVPTSTEYGRWTYRFSSTGAVTQSTSGAFAVRRQRTDI